MQNREEWRQERKKYIGASDVGAILGLSPYKTPVDIYIDKTTDWIEEEESLPAKWGRMLEPLIADWYASKTGYTVELAPDPLLHPKHPFIGANIDRWVNNKEWILECKIANLRKKDEWGGAEGSDEVPDTYLTQVGQQGVVGDFYAPAPIPRVDVAVGFYVIQKRPIEGTDKWEEYPELKEFKMYSYKRDKNLENTIIKRCIHFWNNNVLARVPPEPKTNNDCSLLYPQAILSGITADSEIELEIQKLREIKMQQSILTAQQNDAQVKVKNFMQDAEVLVDPSGIPLATWKNTERGKRMFLVK